MTTEYYLRENYSENYPLVYWVEIEKEYLYNITTEYINKAKKFKGVPTIEGDPYPCRLIDPFCTSQSQRMKPFLLPKMVQVQYPDGEIECMTESEYNAKLISGTGLATIIRRY